LVEYDYNFTGLLVTIRAKDQLYWWGHSSVEFFSFWNC